MSYITLVTPGLTLGQYIYKLTSLKTGINFYLYQLRHYTGHLVSYSYILYDYSAC